MRNALDPEIEGVLCSTEGLPKDIYYQ